MHTASKSSLVARHRAHGMSVNFNHRFRVEGMEYRPGPIARLKTSISCFPVKNRPFLGKFPVYFAVLRLNRARAAST